MHALHLPPDHTLTVIIALSMIILDRVWHISARIHPLTLYKLLVINLGKKVLPVSTAPISQHYISGSLGVVILTLPFIIILAIVVSFAEFKWFFDALILLLCLSFYSVRRQYKQIMQALSGNKKLLARERLSHLVARETTSLSEIGIAKAAIEGYLLRFLQQFVGVLFWFLIAGPIAALSYRLLLEFRWQWHRKRPRYQHFSLPAYWLSQCMLVLPYSIGAVLLLLSSSPLGALKGIKYAGQRDLTSLLLALFGGSLDIQLGGPAIYAGVKYRHMRVGGKRQVRFSDMTYVLRAINRGIWLLTILLTVLLIIFWQLKL